MSDKIREALAGMLAIVDESRGVDGYHLSGDIAEWDTFPEVEIARAALAKQPAPAVPDGWKLAPVDPTIDMEDAGRKAASGFMRLGEAGRVFRAMLAASPAAPAPAPAAQEPVAWLRDDGDGDLEFSADGHGFPVYTAPPAAEQLDHSGDSADMVWCACGDGYPADTHDAGFIHGSGMCQNCDAAIPAKDIQADADDLVVWRITLPSGESCHFGTESMAKAWGRGSGKVERIDLKARPALELVAAEQPDAVKVPRELLDDLELKLYRIDHIPSFHGDAEKQDAVYAALGAARALLGKEGA